MKRKILSGVLTLCMVLAMLPVAAFAEEAVDGGAPLAAPPILTKDAITKANLNDTLSGGLGTNLYSSYDLTVGAGDGAASATAYQASISAEDLQYHWNADSPNGGGYWVGVRVAAPDGAATAKYTFSKTALADDTLSNPTNVDTDADGSKFLAFYSSASSADNMYIGVQFLDSDDAALCAPTFIEVDLSGVHYALQTASPALNTDAGANLSGLSLRGSGGTYSLTGSSLTPGISQITNQDVLDLFIPDTTAETKWNELAAGVDYTIVTVDFPKPTGIKTALIVQENPALEVFYGQGKLTSNDITGDTKTKVYTYPSDSYTDTTRSLSFIAMPGDTITFTMKWGATSGSAAVPAALEKTYTFHVDSSLFAASSLKKLAVTAGSSVSADASQSGESQFYAITSATGVQAVDKWTLNTTKAEAALSVGGFTTFGFPTGDARYAAGSHLVVVNVDNATQKLTAAGSALITYTPANPDAPGGNADADVTQNPDGSVDVKPSEDSISYAIREAQSKGGEVIVSIAPSASTSNGAVNTVLSSAVQNLLLDSKVDALQITSGAFVAELPLDALRSISAAAKGDVTFSVAAGDSGTLSGEARSLIGNRPLYSFDLNCADGSKVEDFGGSTIIISIPYSPKTSEDPDQLCAVYVDENGRASIMTDSKYDAKQGAVVFETGHFSIFGIGDREAAPSGNGSSSGSGSGSSGGTSSGSTYAPSNSVNWTPPQVAGVFTDVTNDHWAKAAVDFVSAKGIMNGVGNSQFGPNEVMTRAMFVTTLGRMSGVNTSLYTLSSFSDVVEGSYYSPYVLWASQMGIVSGVGGDSFAPDRAITREELAVIIVKYAGAMGKGLPQNVQAVTFEDADSISAFAADAVRTVQQAGLMTGKSAARFDPQGTATRAEVAAVILRIAGILG